MAFMDGNGAGREGNWSMAAASVLGLENGLGRYSIAEPAFVGVCFYCEQSSFQKACSAANRSNRKAKMLEKQKALQLRSPNQRALAPHLVARFSDREDLSFIVPNSPYHQLLKPRDGIKKRDEGSNPRKSQVLQYELHKLDAIQPPLMAAGSSNFDRKFRPGSASSTSDASNHPTAVTQSAERRELPGDKFSGYFTSNEGGPCIDLLLCSGRQSTASCKLPLENRAQGTFQNHESNFFRAGGDCSAPQEVASHADHSYCRENEPCFALSLACVDHGMGSCNRFRAKSTTSRIGGFDSDNFEAKPSESVRQICGSETQGKSINCNEMSPDRISVERADIVERTKGSHLLTLDMLADAVKAASCSDASGSKPQFSFNGERCGNDRPLTPPRSETLLKEKSVVRRRVLRRCGKKNNATGISENHGFYYRLLGSLGSSMVPKIDISDESLPDYNINSSNDGHEDGKSRSSSEEDTGAEMQSMAYLPFMAPPLIRSKRGRTQNLPSRFNDSVLGCWKRKTRQKT